MRAEDFKLKAETHYEVILAGGGAAGLSLASALLPVLPSSARILVIDRSPKDRNDRTWCFWTRQPTPVDAVISHSWARAEFIDEHFQRTFDLSPYRYQMVRGIDFYRALHDELKSSGRVDFVLGKVDQITDTPNGAEVMVDGHTFSANWVFDSTFTPKDFMNDLPGVHSLKQHFRGWEIQTTQDCFDPAVATLFDFRTPQNGAMRFFYVLPFAPNRALVEYTLFSHDLLKPIEYDQALRTYIEKVMTIQGYQIHASENGIIPMTDRPFPRQVGKHVLNIGTKGGRVKASSGYAFLRILTDAQAIAHSMQTYGHPFHQAASPARYHWFDQIMLEVMQHHPDSMHAIFTTLFQRNSIQNIFRFLDEEASVFENARLMASLPTLPFIKASIKQNIRT